MKRARSPKNRKLRLWKVLLLVGLVGLGAWAWREPTARFHWFRLQGDRHRAWEEAIPGLPSAHLEHHLAKLMVEIVQDPFEHYRIRGRAAQTLVCLPRSRELARDIAYREVARGLPPTPRCLVQLLTEPPGLPHEHLAGEARAVIRALAAERAPAVRWFLAVDWLAPPDLERSPPLLELEVKHSGAPPTQPDRSSPTIPTQPSRAWRSPQRRRRRSGNPSTLARILHESEDRTARSAAALGLADLGADPRRWLPILFEGLRTTGSGNFLPTWRDLDR